MDIHDENASTNDDEIEDGNPMKMMPNARNQDGG